MEVKGSPKHQAVKVDEDAVDAKTTKMSKINEEIQKPKESENKQDDVSLVTRSDDVSLVDEKDTNNVDEPKKDTNHTDEPEKDTNHVDKPVTDTNLEDRPEIEHLLDFDSPAEKLDVSARNSLYERGQELHKKGRSTASLKCFLRCLSGLDGTNGFPYLPQCLRHVADIYYTQEEYEKAVQFVQAEKLYYETALVDTKDIQQQIEEKRQKESSGESDSATDGKATDPELTDPDVIRAEEYEGLAKMCLDRKQPQLALEYQAKATKLKQQSLGEEHPLTRKSLDFFTVVYGEVGKYQYSESIQKLTVPVVKSDPGDTVPPSGEGSGLRQRKNKSHGAGSDSQKGGSVGDTQIQDTSVTRQQSSQEIQEQEEWVSRMLLVVLFCLCVVVLVGVSGYLYCKMEVGGQLCSSWRSDVYYYYMRFKYWYYSRIVSDGKTYG